MGRDVLSSGFPRSGMAVLPVVVIRSYATRSSQTFARLPAPSGEQLLVEHSADFRECCRRKRRPTSPMRRATLRSIFAQAITTRRTVACRACWIGAGAVLLGLEGAVTREAFLSLCDNRHPSSGKRLTQRQKTTRNDKAQAVKQPIAAYFSTSRFPRRSPFPSPRLLPMTRGS